MLSAHAGPVGGRGDRCGSETVSFRGLAAAPRLGPLSSVLLSRLTTLRPGCICASLRDQFPTLVRPGFWIAAPRMRLQGSLGKPRCLAADRFQAAR